MDAKQAIADLKGELQSLRESGTDVVGIAALENYLGNLEHRADTSSKHDAMTREGQLAAFRAEHERGLAQYDAQQQHSLEMFRSVITYGQGALKSAMLVNGGATVALLAFLAKIWEQTATAPAIAAVATAMAAFAAGVGAGALGTGFTYLTQLSYAESWPQVGVALHVATVVLVLGSYAAFGWGSTLAWEFFVGTKSP